METGKERERDVDEKRSGDERRHRHREKHRDRSPVNKRESERHDSGDRSYTSRHSRGKKSERDPYGDDKHSGKHSSRSERFLDSGCRSSHMESLKSSTKSRFLKPGESSSVMANQSKTYSSSGSIPGWKRKDFVQAKVVEENPHMELIQDEAVVPPSDAASKVDSLALPAYSKHDPGRGETSSDKKSAPRMTEDDLNKLGAKLLRAELMGNEELAAKLRQQKADAHKAMDDAKSAKKSANEQSGSDESDNDKEREETGRVSQRETPLGGHWGASELAPKRAVSQQRKFERSIDKCKLCFENADLKRHLVIAVGIRCYVCLPAHRSLADGHCLVVPMQHVAATTLVDDDVYAEMQIFRKGLTRMFADRDEDAVFMETCARPGAQRHMHVECVPVPRSDIDVAPAYFRKALAESDAEWSDNAKVIALTQERDVRRAVPRDFPFFAVTFGDGGSGFAHVIEDERRFPEYFGREVVGGILGAEPRLWLNPPRENFDEQRKKALLFAEWWKPYDWTHRIRKDS
ncbi:PREDICTED: CWF19-like protein 2 [Priapulus caudatus]|uniref:CWF19-like protein 2 n=1 Tax=Priapulus caudatus TaxID=37621 RepID=A0ABM1E3C7_PRICU|nr:PREDICTED: CWF19-like protein 2 [Priapulus caudatus]